MFGILALGSKESLRFSPYEECYEQINGPEKIYQEGPVSGTSIVVVGASWGGLAALSRLIGRPAS